MNVTKAVTVTADAPVVGFSFAPISPKVGETVTFTNTTANATSYEWSSVPTGFSSKAENPQHQFTTAGTYAVTLTATGPGGSESLTQNVVVADLDPIAGFNFSPQNPIAGTEVTFTNISQNATSYQWSSVPAGFSSTEANPKHTFTSAGSYAVTLVATGPGGSNQTTQTIVVAAPVPTADFSFSPATPTAGQEVTFTSTSTNVVSFQWSSAPAGFSSTAANPKYTFAIAGSYEITLSVTGPGGSVSVSKTVVVAASAAAPNADFSFSPAAPMAGQEVTFTNARTNATSYQWSSVPAGFSSTGANPKYTFAAAGSYQITLVATGAGGTDEISTTVVVSAAAAAPTASFTYSPQNPEAGQDVTFANTSQNANSYLWTFTIAGGSGGRMMDNTFTSTATNPVIKFPSEGSWQVTLCATGAG